MQTYRTFFLNDDGRLVDVALAECVDDQDAIEWAERRIRRNPDYHLVEIWHAERLIATVQRS